MFSQEILIFDQANNSSTLDLYHSVSVHGSETCQMI